MKRILLISQLTMVLLLGALVSSSSAAVVPLPAETPIAQTEGYLSLQEAVTNLNALSAGAACKTKVKRTSKGKKKKVKTCKRLAVGEDAFQDASDSLEDATSDAQEEVDNRAQDRNDFFEDWIEEYSNSVLGPIEDDYNAKTAANQAKFDATQAALDSGLEATLNQNQATRDGIVAGGVSAVKAARKNNCRIKYKKKSQAASLKKCLANADKRSVNTSDMESEADNWLDQANQIAETNYDKALDAAQDAQEKSQEKIDKVHDRVSTKAQRKIDKNSDKSQRVLDKLAARDQKAVDRLRDRGASALNKLTA